MQPTTEQDRCVELFKTGDPLVIEAGAGTGKSSTLRMLAESTPNQTGTYVAFNKAIVVEAGQKMPASVYCSTAHSLAMRQVGHLFRDRMNWDRPSSAQLARLLGVDPLMVTYGTQRKVLQPGHLASLVMRGILRFCASADPSPTGAHLPYLDGIDPPDENGKRTWKNNNEVRAMLAPAMLRAWADVLNPAGRLPAKHDYYLKYWQLHDPKIVGDFILIDEGQDMSPVMLDAVAQQDGAQVVMVGDTNQQLYEWRGSVDALARTTGARARLSRSFRFGPAIAEIANAVLDVIGSDLRLTGTDSIDSVVGPVAHPHVVLARTNAVAVETVLLMQHDGKRCHLVGGGAEIVSFAKAAALLMDREKCWHPELACFTSWGEVQDYVQRDPQGDELKVMVGLVDTYGVDVIIEALEQVTAEAAADVIVSTAHKAKGREWGRVRLAGDFPDVADPSQPGELRLLYVAATRAINRLDVTACGALTELTAEPV